MKQFALHPPAAVITATGPDAFAFLQSQGTQDLRGLANGGAAYGLWLDRKGRIQGDSHILRLGDESFLLASHATPAATLLAHLQANLVADEVEFADVTGGRMLLTAWGEGAEAPPPGKFVNEPNGPVFSWSGRLTRGASRVFLGASAGALAGTVGGLREAGWTPSGPEAMEAERISAGIPLVPVDAGPDSLPQESGLEVAAVSFTKGCYLGQEVMARLHAQGRVQRGLVRLSLETPARGLPAPVLAAEGREIGRMTSQALVAGRWTGLAVVNLRHLPPDGGVKVEGVPAQRVED